MPANSHKFPHWDAILAVIRREIQASIRQPATYWLRSLAGGIAIIALFATVNTFDTINSTEMGTQLFLTEHSCLMFILIIWTPLATADCISKEKREGTLGLLFLTDLNSKGIILGKTFIQTLRSLMLWLSCIPILAIPFLLGGVQMYDFTIAILFEMQVACLGIAAGILASVYCKQKRTALLSAYIIFVVYYLMLAIVFALIWFPLLPTKIQSQINVGILMLASFVLPWFSNDYPWSQLISTAGQSLKIWLAIVVGCLFFCLSLLYFSLHLASLKLAKNWQDAPPSKRVQNMEKRFCTPLFKKRFKQDMAFLKNLNPVTWLIARSWQTRLFTLGISVLIAIASVLLVLCEPLQHNIQKFWGISLFLFFTAYIYAGVTGFTEEKTTGALELILVTTISPSKIILGRALGLFLQFLIPGILYILMTWSVSQLTSPFRYARMTWLDGVLYLGCYCSAPFFATYTALRIKKPFMATILAGLMLLTCVAFQMSLAGFFYTRFTIEGSGAPIRLACILIGNAGFIALTFFLLKHSLNRRLYSF